MREHMHITEILPAYALHCLNPEETVVVAEHLGICRKCSEEFESLQAVTDLLVLAVPDAYPGPKLKTRILQRVQPETCPVPGKALIRVGRQRLSALLRPIAPVWSVVSAVIIMLLIINSVISWQRIDSLERSFSARDFQVVVLNDTSAVPEATGQIVISRDGEFGALTVANLPVLEPEYTYQVWLIDNGQQSSGGTFTVNQRGYGMLTITSSVPLFECDITITIEPLEGSAEPTGETVLQTI